MISCFVMHHADCHGLLWLLWKEANITIFRMKTKLLWYGAGQLFAELYGVRKQEVGLFNGATERFFLDSVAHFLRGLPVLASCWYLASCWRLQRQTM